MSHRLRNQPTQQRGREDAHRWWLPSLTMFMVLACGVFPGCGTDQADVCEVADVGRGPCCQQLLPGSLTIQGVCRDGLCVSKRYRLSAPECGPTPLEDGAVSDARGTDEQDAANAQLADAAYAGDTAIDAELGPCEQAICDVGEICDSESGRCVDRSYRLPGGACSDSDSCPGGQCLTEGEFGFTDGFCSVACDDDASCEGGRCARARDRNICLRACRDRGRCRTGWVCDEGDAESVCRPDCRRVGCGGQGRCDEGTGLCQPAPVRCRYPCRGGESCEDGRCVRRDGTCVTDYHCALGDVCRASLCELRDGTPCQGSAMCSERQRCVPVTDTDGQCAPVCELDQDCPLHRECDPTVNACLYRRCGDAAAPLFGECQSGAQDQYPGTCLPRGEGDSPEVDGYCFEGGRAERDEPCDAQSDGREPDARAVQCQPGYLCYGDPDDPLEPVRQKLGRGVCRAACDPLAPQCQAGRFCVSLTTDEIATGVCLPSDCMFGGPDECPSGRLCYPYQLGSPAGQCLSAGQALPGQSCVEAADCLLPSICANRQAGRTCISLCLPETAPCGHGACYREPGWAFGVCI